MGNQWGARVDEGQLWAHQDVQSRGERECLCLGCGLSIQDSEGCNEHVGELSMDYWEAYTYIHSLNTRLPNSDTKTTVPHTQLTNN